MTAPPRTLQEILEQARALPEAQQLSFLERTCTDAQQYLSAVEQLRSHPDAAGDVLRETRPYATAAGERIGAYRLVRSLGEGGMGEVFLAQRADEQYQQQVAIKVVRRGLLSRHLEGRLIQERQILASLDHPNIARLLDGGTTRAGTPYIVMEYVDGEPIDVYCNRRRLPLSARLQLIQTVCAAVHRAHQNLIVHRDLKPSNILVTAQGVPKLLDFGIAKLLDQRQRPQTLALTQADHRVLTPDHASPEQIMGDTVTTASDIYVLGVLMYELLCGCKPYRIAGQRLSVLERIICEEDAPAPSVTVLRIHNDDPQTGEAIAHDRSVTPQRLSRQLAGDLDIIIATAMRKEPQRRYASAQQLAADIDRHLQGLPLMARADSWHYIYGKFIKRHRAAVAAATAFIVLLVSFSITTALQARRIEQERDLAQLERASAQNERERAEAVSRFLVDSFLAVDPERARGHTITAKEVLDVGAQRITGELQHQPALQATLLDTIGSVYLGLGDLGEAEPLLERALSLRRELFGNDGREVADSLHSLNRLHGERGQWQRAEALAREALAISTTHTGADSLQSAREFCQLGVIKHRQGDLDAAEELLRRCLQIRTTHLGEQSAQISAPLDTLASIAHDRHDFVTAERLYRQALDIDRRVRDGDHPLYIRHLHNLATVLHARGELQAAQPLYRESLALFNRVLGEAHPQTIDAMNNFARFLMDLGQLDEAHRLYLSVLEADRKLRPDHAYVGHDLASLARLALRRGRYSQAEDYFREALTIYQRTLPASHGYTASAYTGLARTLLALDRPREATTTVNLALAIWAQEYGELSPWYATAHAIQGRAATLLGQLTEAQSALTASYPILSASGRAADIEMADEVKLWIEDVFRRQNRPDAAAEYFAGQPARPASSP